MKGNPCLISPDHKLLFLGGLPWKGVGWLAIFSCRFVREKPWILAPGAKGATLLCLKPVPCYQSGAEMKMIWATKKVLGCLGDLLGMKCYPLMWGIIHEPWNKDPYQTTSIIECTAGFFSRLTVSMWAQPVTSYKNGSITPFTGGL